MPHWKCLRREAVASPTDVHEPSRRRERKRYGELSPDDAKRLRELEGENRRLEKIVADQAMDIDMLKESSRIPPGSIPGMEDRTVTISALSKTYAVTGWRVGWVIAPDALASGIRSTHDFLTVAAAAPLQEAGTVALGLPEQFYVDEAAAYTERRDLLVSILRETGFKVEPPQGAYYVMADIRGVARGDEDDVAFATRMVEEVGVAVVPGSSFFSDPAKGSHLVRFAFPKKLETLEAAGERLRRAFV